MTQPGDTSLSIGLGMARRGLMLVLSSPSGAGKTTLSRKLLEHNRHLTLSVSVTTRPMRPGEVDGRDYRFIDRARYDAMVQAGELLEHATVFEHHYGTPASHVSEALSTGMDVLFDIDWQGTRQLAARCREDLVSLFILPPSMTELERRLKQRAQDSDDVVAKRMAKARAEMSHWQEYDYVLINHDFDETLTKIDAILQAERLKRSRQPKLADFIAAL